MEGEEESFDDDWWDSLAIDPVMDTQLQALELQAHPSSHATASTKSASPDHPTLQSQLEELRDLYTKQQELIKTLTHQAQQQQGEIAVVRANWSRALEQNSGLQQQQAHLEVEYRERVEQIQRENQRQMEKLETAAAFRVSSLLTQRIEQDTNRTAWPSTLRRRAPVMLTEAETTKRTPGTLATPTHNRIGYKAISPKSMQTPVSPVSLTRRKRSMPEEPTSPSRTRSTKTPLTHTQKGIFVAHTEFPHFINSFIPPPPTNLTNPLGRNTLRSPPSSPFRETRSSSPATPSPELRPIYPEEKEPPLDVATYVFTVLFCYRTRWATYVMCQPYVSLPAPDVVPGTAYYLKGPGLHLLDSSLGAEASGAHEADKDVSPTPLLLHLLSMQFPHAIPASLYRRFKHAAESLWDSVTKGSSYNVFLAECGHVVDNVVRDMSTHALPAPDAAIARVWESQAAILFGTVAAALRVLTGIFLRLNMVRNELTQTHYVAAMLNWMASLGVAHPDFVFYFLKKLQYLNWIEPEDVAALGRGMVPSSQDDQEMLPSSQDTQKPSQSDTPSLATPVQVVKILIECVRKSHCAPLDVSSPESQPQKDDTQSLPAWDMGIPARTALLSAVLRFAKVTAWSIGASGLHELQPFLQEPGVLLSLLDAHACAPEILLLTVEFLTLLIPDPLTLHMALASPYDSALQLRVPARLLQVRFPVVDILAKHLVDRRGDTPGDFAHRLHCAILLFMSCAGRHADTAVILSESVPLLPALIQCLSWDTEEVWSGSAGNERTERYVMFLPSALERVCLSTRLLHQLYTPETSAGRGLAEKLLSTQAQAILNGIRHAFVVAMGRIAFAREPSWLHIDVPGSATQERSRMRSQLENAAVLAGDLIDMVLSPSETDEIFELLAEEGT